MTGVQIEVQGIDELSTTLQVMAERGMRLRPVMRTLGTVLIGIVDANFAAEGHPKWKPLSAKTVLSYQAAAVQRARNTKQWKSAKRDSTRQRIESSRVERDVTGRKLLQDSGALKKSITVGMVTDSSVELGSSLPYARIQQLGGTIGPVTIHPRNKQALAIPTANGVIIRRSANIPERKIPARPYLSVRAEDVPLLGARVEMYIREGK